MHTYQTKGYTGSRGYTPVLPDDWQPTTSRRDDMGSVRGYAFSALVEAEAVYQGELD